MLGLLLCASGTSSAASTIFGRWSLAPEETAQSNAQVQEALRAEGKKPSRKERKRAKKRAKQRASIIPEILKTSTLRIKQQGAHHIALVPQKGKTFVVQTNGQLPSLSLSQWGKTTFKTVGFSTWEGERLVIETTPRQGLHIIHSYHVDSQGLLVQSIELYDGLDALNQQRIFKRDPAELKPRPTSASD